jgi:hypothetical protein
MRLNGSRFQFSRKTSKEREIWVLFTSEDVHIAHAQNRLDLIFKEKIQQILEIMIV